MAKKNFYFNITSFSKRSIYIYIYIAINFYKRVCLLTDIEHINAFDFILSSCLTTNHHKEEFIYIETRIILV